MWEEAIQITTLSISEALRFIDDALCFGFEFKVENSTIYFKEFT